MHFKVHYVTSLVLVFIFCDVILVARGQLAPDSQDDAARTGGIPDSDGPLNGAGPPLDPLPGSNPQLGGTNPPIQANTHLTLPVCREGWTEAKINKVPICVYLNKNPLTWQEARDSCGKDYGFLIKLESPVSIGPYSLQQYLVNNHTQAIWTGLHEENDHLMWDEITPHLVRHYNDFMEVQTSFNRIWDWDIDDIETDAENCGELEISDLWQITSGDSRKKRSPEDLSEIDQVFQSNSRENNRRTATNPLARLLGTSQNSRGNTQLNKRLLQTQMRNVERTITTMTRRQNSPNIMQVLPNNEGLQNFGQLRNVPRQRQEDSQDTFPMIPRLDQPNIRPLGIEQWNNRMKMRNKKVTFRTQTRFTSEEQAFLNSLGGLNFESTDSNQASSTPLNPDVGFENEDDDSESTPTPPTIARKETSLNSESDRTETSNANKKPLFLVKSGDSDDSEDKEQVTHQSSSGLPNPLPTSVANINAPAVPPVSDVADVNVPPIARVKVPPTIVGNVPPIAGANVPPITGVNGARIAEINVPPTAEVNAPPIVNPKPTISDEPAPIARVTPAPVSSFNKETNKEQDEDDDKTEEKEQTTKIDSIPLPTIPVFPQRESTNTDDRTEIKENTESVLEAISKKLTDDEAKEQEKSGIDEDESSAVKAPSNIGYLDSTKKQDKDDDEDDTKIKSPESTLRDPSKDDHKDDTKEQVPEIVTDTSETSGPVNSMFGSLFTNDDTPSDTDTERTDISNDNNNAVESINDVVEAISEKEQVTDSGNAASENSGDAIENIADAINDIVDTMEDNQNENPSDSPSGSPVSVENENTPDDDNLRAVDATDDQSDDGLPGVSFIGQEVNQRPPPPPPVFVGDTTNSGSQIDSLSDLVEEIVESVSENDTDDETGAISDDVSQETDLVDEYGNDADVFDLETESGPLDHPVLIQDGGDTGLERNNDDTGSENEDDNIQDNQTEDNELPREAASSGGEERVHDFGDLDELDELPAGIGLRLDIPPQDIIQHIPQTTNNELSRMFARRKAKMKLSNCKKKLPSMCFSYPLALEKKASPCGDGWYGNVFIGKCYKAVFPALNFDAAKERCQLEGGILATIESGLDEKLVIMMIAKSQNEHFRQGRVKPVVWANSQPIWKNNERFCYILTPYGPNMAPCSQILEAVCEKLAVKPASETNTDTTIKNSENIDMTPHNVHMSVDNEDNSLDCDARSPFPELPTLWFKDGVLVDIKIQRRSESVLPGTGSVGTPNSPLPNPALSPTSSIYLNAILTETLKYLSSRQISPAALQGKYWCEVWSMKPFQRRKSKPFIVTYSDVISFIGSVQLPHVTDSEAFLYNTISKAFPRAQKVERDLGFVMGSASSSLRTNIPYLQGINTHGHHLTKTKPLRLEYYTYLKMQKNYTMANEGIAYILLRRNLREVMSNISYILSLPNKTPPYAIRSIDLTSTVACPTVKLRDQKSGLMAMFRRSATHTNVESEELCEGERAGSASCNGDYFSGAFWDKIVVKKLCNNHTAMVKIDDDDDDDKKDEDDDGQKGEYGKVMSKMTSEQRLKELAESKVEEEDVETVIEETAVITEETKELTATDVDYIADIMDKTETVKTVTKEISKNILKTVDKVMSMDEKEIKKANKEKSAANRIIKRFEKLAETSEVEDDGKLKIVEDNVAMEIWRLDLQKNPIIGMAAKKYKEERLSDRFMDKDIITIYNESQLYDNVEAAIELPPELIQEAMTEKGKATRLVMVVYRDGRLFKAAEISDTEEEIHDEELGKLNSYVISASLGGKKIQGLTNKVKTVFRPLERLVDSSSICVFWDFNMNDYRGGWSTEGCVYDGITNGHDICLCDHLTNFAVLMDFHGQGTPVPRDHVESLSIISLIGLSLSILGLSLTIISYVFFKKLRHGRAQQTLFNLALAMLCSWVVFLVGIKQTHSPYGCLIVAALLHYFILSSFMWMLMEAFLQYLTFVKVLGTYVTRYALKTVIIAWGLPIIPVVTVLSIDYDLYNGGSDYCWMKVEAFYWAFALPVGLICLCNLTVFIVTIISICRRPSGLRSNQSKPKMVIANLQAAITSFILLGLTWILGYLSLLPHARLVFQYAFTILNSLQGFFIFILFVARKKRVRDQWMMICCCRTPVQEKATRSLSASASIPSSCSGRSSYSGRTERSDSTQTTTSFVNHEYQSIYAIPIKKRCSRESLYFRKS